MRHPQVEIDRRRHAHRQHVGRAVAPGADLVERRKIGDTAQMRDAAGVNNGGSGNSR